GGQPAWVAGKDLHRGNLRRQVDRPVRGAGGHDDLAGTRDGDLYRVGGDRHLAGDAGRVEELKNRGPAWRIIEAAPVALTEPGKVLNSDRDLSGGRAGRDGQGVDAVPVPSTGTTRPGLPGNVKRTLPWVTARPELSTWANTVTVWSATLS